MKPPLIALLFLAAASLVGGIAAAVAEAGAEAPAATCHGQAAADCHGDAPTPSDRRQGRLKARAARSAGREDARASKASARSCHGSGGAGRSPVVQSAAPQPSLCECGDDCSCRR